MSDDSSNPPSDSIKRRKKRKRPVGRPRRKQKTRTLSSAERSVHADSLTIVGINPLAIAVAKRIDETRKVWGLSSSELANRIGAPLIVLRAILRGREFPGTEMAERLKLWMYEGADFSKTPLRETRKSYQPRKDWVRQKTVFPPDIIKRIRKQAYELGISPSAFLHLAAQRLLDHEPTLLSLKDAALQIEEARTYQALMEAPAITSILEGDKEYILKVASIGAGSRKRKVGRPALNPAPIMSTYYDHLSTQEEIVRTVVVEDGPAIRIVNFHDERRFKDV